MQLVFLGLALAAALVELSTGTFYLAAVALIALGTAALGFLLPDDDLILVFLGGSLIALALVRAWHRREARKPGLPDLDAGQFVTISAHGALPDHVVVTYRGTRWDGVMIDGAQPIIGNEAVIIRKLGSQLQLAAPTTPSKPQSQPPFLS